MLQKYFPIVGEVSSPLAACAALGFTAEAVKVAISGISNQVLEILLWEAVEETATYRKEIEISTSELEKTRTASIKESRALRYRAACTARTARRISKNGRSVKAMRRPIAKGSLKGLSGLSIEICRQRTANAQAAVRSAATIYNAAVEAVEKALQGGDIGAILSSVAALKAAVRALEVRHIELRFAREMLAISLARHSA